MIRPGGIELTVIPYLPTSRDNPLAQACIAALAEKAALSRSGSDLPVMLMTRPQARSIICGSKAWVIWRWRVKLRVIAFPSILRRIQGQRPAAAGAIDQDVDMAETGKRGIAKLRCRVRRHDILRNQQRARSLPPLDLAPEFIEKMDAAGNPCDLNAFGG